MPNPTLLRGALPAPRSALAAAKPYRRLVAAAPTHLVRPQKISMWGNDVHGDCVSAEEAFAKACHDPEVFVSDTDVIAWATRHGVLEGAYLVDVLTWMQTDGFADAFHTYDDGPHLSVDWTNGATLRSAISRGPVKLGVAATQIETAYWSNGGRTGWVGTGFHADADEDHCVALCGYGSLAWLAQQLGGTLPAGVDGSAAGYALFTWNSIGVVDAASLVAVTHEAWLRDPTTVVRSHTGWSDWAGLGGGLTSSIAVGRNADGRLEAFVRGGDNALYHLWQTSPNGTWTDWSSLGGFLTSDPVVASNADGRLEVFVRGGDNALYHLWQTSPNGTWSDWAGMGGTLTSNVAVGRNADGRLEAFVRGGDNALYHLWQTSPNGTWSDWQGLGGTLSSDPAVASNADGRLEVFVTGTDNGLYHLWQTSPLPNWSDWEGLGGTLTSMLAVGRNADGRLEAFVRGGDNGLYHLWQTSPNGTWSAWEGLGGTLTSDPTVGSNRDGRLEVFVRGSDNALYHRWQTSPNGTWADWAGLGGFLTGNVALGSNADGRLEAFVRGGDNSLFHLWQA